jgi:hypothetical protein
MGLISTSIHYVGKPASARAPKNPQRRMPNPDTKQRAEVF